MKWKFGININLKLQICKQQKDFEILIFIKIQTNCLNNSHMLLVDSILDGANLKLLFNETLHKLKNSNVKLSTFLEKKRI